MPLKIVMHVAWAARRCCLAVCRGNLQPSGQTKDPHCSQASAQSCGDSSVRVVSVTSACCCSVLTRNTCTCDEAYVTYVHSLLRGLSGHPWRHHPDYRATVERSDVAPIVSLLLVIASSVLAGSPPTAFHTDAPKVVGGLLRGSHLCTDLNEALRHDVAILPCCVSSICQPESLKLCLRIARLLSDTVIDHDGISGISFRSLTNGARRTSRG
jgi:hypothetical protein